jgi:protocatechuate 3,4-dioxygenase beta subunit
MRVVMCAAILAGLAQLPPPPPSPPVRQQSPLTRDGAAADRKGTAVIRGRVRSADGRALRRAAVSIRGGGLSTAKTVSTGLDGEYEIGEVPAGRYTVAATRGGYLRAEYGQRHYGEQGTPLEVADGATLDEVDLTMERAGIVSGRVTDETGEAVANAQVWVQQTRFYEGRRRLVPLASARTDDTGLYRIASIAPGDYVVAAYFRETWASDDNKETLGYAPSFSPGTASPGEAQRVKVVAGQEAAAIDIMLVPGRAAAISGTVITADGAPLSGASVGLTQEIMGPGGGSMSMIGNSRAAADGTFTLRSIPPGEYQLRATGSPGDGAPQTAWTTIAVAGTDLQGIVLGGNTGGLVTGRLVADAGARLPAGALGVNTRSATFERSQSSTPPDEDGRAGTDGTFTRRAPAGPAFIRPFGLPSGWALKQVVVGGRDQTDTPVDIHPGQTLADVTVVISNTLPAVSGRVTNAREAGPVILVPADPARWFEASGALRTARPDGGGKFRFDNVRAGDYLLVAVDRMETWQLNDPDFLHPLREKATKITVAEETVTFDLQVVR